MEMLQEDVAMAIKAVLESKKDYGVEVSTADILRAIIHEATEYLVESYAG